MTKIVLFGKNGQIGSQLTELLSSWNLTALGKNDVDIVDSIAVSEIFTKIRPEIVINAVAFNDVDQAELRPDLAMRINATANGHVAGLSAQHNALYITFSSDFVFDGRKRTPYLETDTPHPINKYGESKLKGDLAVQKSGANYIILRTSSVYSLNRPCFLTKIIEQAQKKNSILVRSDLFSSPTSAQFIAHATAYLIKNYRVELRRHSGLYNLCSSGVASRSEWAKAIQKILNLGVDILPLDEPVEHGASRPVYSHLNNRLFQHTFNMVIPDWEDMLYSLLEKK
jgi:dTDP-4-dehydrorhamnose reductase